MGRLIGLLVAGAVGYVLGAKAGRERYDQIQKTAKDAWNNPKIQQGVGAVKDTWDTNYKKFQQTDLGGKVQKFTDSASERVKDAASRVSSKLDDTGKTTDGPSAS